jgi:hypothetical protein
LAWYAEGGDGDDLLVLLIELVLGLVRRHKDLGGWVLALDCIRVGWRE